MDVETILKEFLDGRGLFYSKIQISDNIRQEEETGYLYCDNAILGHIGTQKYLGKEIRLKGKKAKKVIEMIRDEESVFDESSIASFEGKPITIYHPKDNVDSKNYKKFMVGAIKDVKRDGDNLVGNLVIYDEYTIKEILDGRLKDLSLGYKAKVLELADGTYKQTEIVINHLAIVEEGRAVNAQIVDNKTVEENILEPKDFVDTVFVTKTNRVVNVIETYNDVTGESTYEEDEKHKRVTSKYDELKQQLFDSKKNLKGEKDMKKDFKYFMVELKDLSTYPKSDFRDKAYEALFNDCKETLEVDLPTIEDTTKINVVAKSVGLKDSEGLIPEKEEPKALDVFAQDENRYFENLYRKFDDVEVARKYANMTYHDVYSAIVEGRVL